MQQQKKEKTVNFTADEKIVYTIRKEDVQVDATEGRLQFLYPRCRLISRTVQNGWVTYTFENALSPKEQEECLENF